MAVALTVLAVALFAFVFAGPCPVRAAWGVRCPFCGIQRAAEALARGDFAGAFHWNAPLLPVCALLIHALARPPRTRWWVVFVIAALGFGAIRNLPFYPLY
jgi:hypothetical protein